jgi:hypothetical protein
MDIKIAKLSPEEQTLFDALDKKMIESQQLIDVAMTQYQELMTPITQKKDEIRKLRKSHEPLAQMKSALCSPGSRDKYFPDDTKKSLHDKIKKYLSE